jgi:MoCo/4Fe-4S cofactor protein with predicted Tat translocation signal
MENAGTPDLSALRARLRGATGKHYWRSLEAVAETPEFQEYLHREFPQNATEWLDPVGRRSFLKLMSASLALAGVGAACTVQPRELIVPYVRQPEEEIPGRPLFFATAMSLGGEVQGLLVESHEGRPTKVEGNPDHPASLGATDLYAQASLLTLYDPDRSPSILQLGEIRPWSAFIAAVRAGLSAQSAVQGAGLRILTETVNSPTLARQIQQVQAANPGAKWIQWEPVTRDNARAGARMAQGQYLHAIYDFTKADVILSLHADFLASEGGANLYYSRQFASRRRVDVGPDRLNRMYAVEPTPTVTGANADHRVPMKASEIESFARAIAAKIGATGAIGAIGVVPGGAEQYVEAIAADLTAHRGTSLVVAGDAQPPAVHALAHAMNQALGNVGATVRYQPPAEIVPTEQHAALRELVTDMEAGRVQMLLIVGESNPVYTAPADLNFADAMAKVALRMHSGLFVDETATLCHWHVPAAHYLEAWSDARSFDGTVTIVQPLIQPMYGGKSAHELIATLSDRPERNGYDVVREYWMANAPEGALAAGATAAPAASASGAAGASAATAAGAQTQAAPGERSVPLTGAPATPGAQQATPSVPPAAGSGAQAGTGARGTQPSEQNVAATVAAQVAPPPMTPEQRAAAQFERVWRKWLHDGFVPGTGFSAATVAPVALGTQGGAGSEREVGLAVPRAIATPAAVTAPSATVAPAASASARNASAASSGGTAPQPLASQGGGGGPIAPAFEVNFRRDPTVYDGRFANNGWLQELPKPVTKLTWDNAAQIAPGTAERLDVSNGDIIEVRHEGRRLRLPVFINPGHAQDSITVTLGYGRTRAGRVGNATGFNAYVLRGSPSPSFGAAEVSKTGDYYRLVTTQDHWSIEGRNIVRANALAEYKENPRFAQEMSHVPGGKLLSLYPAYDYSNSPQWGMAIDMNTCTGCGACVVACVAENNIPVVGKEQVGKNREMHWLRVDRYYTGDLDNPDTYWQPLPCQQCENAPCEVVCPVAATTHSDEGLNDMVYNRCVGTRYCSNNCPYKVRRFNFLLYQDWNTSTFQLQRNPDVTVRSRGVMEKCTYCVQRINAARIQAKREERDIRDGDVLTACQSVCPTDAIVFGNVLDPNSRVTQLKRTERNYALLEDLNTRPRTTYLAAVRNPNPALPWAGAVGGHAVEMHGPSENQREGEKH